MSPLVLQHFSNGTRIERPQLDPVGPRDALRRELRGLDHASQQARVRPPDSDAVVQQSADSSRILRDDQVAAAPAVGTLVTGGGVAAVIGGGLAATGSSRDEWTGLYSFVRNGGGAGYQGLTRNPAGHTAAILAILNTKGGGVLAGVEIGQIPGGQVKDLADPTVRAEFIARYASFGGMYDRCAGEGVVAVQGTIPAGAVTALINVAAGTDAGTMAGYVAQILSA